MSILSSPVTAIRGAFLVQSLCIGGFFARLADMRLAMDASPAELGIGLLGFDVGAFLIFPFAARLVDRLGTRSTLLWGLPLFSLAVALSALADDIPIFFVICVLIAAGYTVTAIALSVEADRVEYAQGRRIMNSCHGMWSLGFFASSLLSTGIVALGISPAPHLFGALPLETAAALLFLLPMRMSLPRPHAGQEARRFVVPTIATLVIIAFAFGSIWLEAAARTWTVIYMRDVFSAESWVAIMVLSVCIGAQVVGRMLADGWIERFGPVKVAMVLSAISLVGTAMVVFAPSVPVALTGFVLVGFGVATAFPQALSAAARLGDRPAAENVAAVQMMNSFVLFLAPPAMGFAATEWGLRASFALVLPFLVLAVILSRNLAERRPEIAATT